MIYAWNSTHTNSNRKNWTNQCGLKMQFFLLQDQPSCWFSQDYGFLGWWSDQLLCSCKCLTTHEDMIPSNKTMLRGEYVHFVPFWWGSNSLRLLDIFVFKIEIFKVWTYVFSLHIGTRSMQKNSTPTMLVFFHFPLNMAKIFGNLAINKVSWKNMKTLHKLTWVFLYIFTAI